MKRFLLIFAVFLATVVHADVPGITFQKRGDIVLAPIRAGIGLRLGANVGYLKYTRRPTWNPF